MPTSLTSLPQNSEIKPSRGRSGNLAYWLAYLHHAVAPATEPSLLLIQMWWEETVMNSVTEGSCHLKGKPTVSSASAGFENEPVLGTPLLSQILKILKV